MKFRNAGAEFKRESVSKGTWCGQTAQTCYLKQQDDKWETLRERKCRNDGGRHSPCRAMLNMCYLTLGRNVPNRFLGRSAKILISART